MIYACIEHLEPDHIADLPKRNFGLAYNLGDVLYDNGVLSLEKAYAYVQANVPKNVAAIFLDIEPPNGIWWRMHDANLNGDKQAIKVAQRPLVDMITALRAIRPGALFGVYGIEPEWINFSLRGPTYRERRGFVDRVVTSAYCIDSKEWLRHAWDAEWLAYSGHPGSWMDSITSRVERAEKVTGLPTAVFTSHRYDTSGQPSPYGIVPDDHARDAITAAKTGGADDLVIWGDDEAVYAHPTYRPMVQADIDVSGRTPAEYFHDLHGMVLDRIGAG